MNVNTQVVINQTVYSLVSKPADRYGELRFNLSKEGQAKPYSLSVSSTLYKDSEIPGYGCSCPGWIYKKSEVRKCKHIRKLAEFLEEQKVAA